MSNVIEETPNEATPRESPAEQDELFSAIAELKSTVVEWKKGQIDEATVEAIAQRAMAAARREGTTHPEGFLPADEDDTFNPKRGKFSRLDVEGRFNYILQTPAERIAPMLR